VLMAWRAAGQRGAKERAAWKDRLAKAGPAAATALEAPAAASRMADVSKAIAAAKQTFAADAGKRATRVWSQLVLEHVTPVVPELIGGSADLSPSNGTRTKHHTPVAPGSFGGNYIHYGVREHAMAAAMNGIALSGGFIPYGGTFLVFTDYCRPSIRLSALMRQRVIYVMTHDSIGLGEDGPTHQPVEHLAALRAIPNLNVFRPADGVETAECWAVALASTETPSVLALTRQNVPNARTEPMGQNHSARGGYLLHEAPGGKRAVTLIASGSEIGIALKAAELLAAKGIGAAIVSMPCFELFRQQDAAYRETVLGKAPRVGIEAGIEQGWREWLRPTDAFVGMSDFGASAPAPKLFAHFGITPERVADVAQELA